MLLGYLILAAAFYLICGDQLRFRDDQTDMLEPAGTIGEITADTVVEQDIHSNGRTLTEITLYGATYARENTGYLLVEVYDADRLIASQTVDVSGMENNALFSVPVFAELPKGGIVTLRLRAPESAGGIAVTLYYGNSMQTGRASIDAMLGQDELVRVNGSALDGALCIQLKVHRELWFGTYYRYIAAAGFVVLAVYCAVMLKKNKAGRGSLVINLLIAFEWSFLNPLLTMLVQYLVFSMLFRSSIPNFALYLLTGIVCFSFFNEATSMTLTSIVGNASLITKVYVPKYIYPLTRVMSSTINFLLALIPLFMVMLVTRTPVRPAILLLPLPVICLFAVSLGIGMLLASAMVFFRYTQFLWSVLSILWMYVTPIFYPESILPARWMPLFRCNPLYHIIRFVRIIMMDGISPEPKAYGLMLIASFAPLALGVWVFIKTQDKFVLNL